MRRRAYLTAVGATIGVAGCSSDTEKPDPMPDGNRTTDGGEPDADQTATQTPRPAGEAEIARTDLIRGESFFGEIPWALVDVANSTAADHGEVRVQVRFYNEADELMTTRASIVGVLPAGETWRYYQRFATQNRDQLASIETSITDSEPRSWLSPPPEPVVVQSEMAADPDSGVTVTGVVNTNDYRGDLELLAKVYDSEGRFRGTVPAFQRDIQPDETWRFDVTNIGIRTPQDRPQITQHEIVLSGL